MNFIKERDYKPELKEKNLIKLVEEVGELSEVIRKDMEMINKEINDSIEEELYDFFYCICALANY